MSTGAATVFDHMVKNIEESSELDRALAAILRDLLAEGKRPVIRRRTRRARKTTAQKAREFLESTDRGYVSRRGQKAGRVAAEIATDAATQAAIAAMKAFNERHRKAKS